MKFCIRVVVLAIMVAASSASAEDQTPRFLGPGAMSCASWLKERQAKSPVSRIMDGWVLGYLSGSSVTEQVIREDLPDTLQGIDANAVFAWLDKYCSEHPLDQLVSATIRLLSTLRQRARER